MTDYSSYLNIFLGKQSFVPQDAAERGAVLPTQVIDPNDIEYKVDMHLPVDLIRSILPSDLGMGFSTAFADFGFDGEPIRTASIAPGVERPTYFNLDNACQEAGVSFPLAETSLYGKFRADPGADDIMIGDTTVRFNELSNTANDDFATLPTILAKALGAQMQPLDPNGDESLLRLMVTNESFLNLIRLVLSQGRTRDGTVTSLVEQIKANEAMDKAKSYDVSTLDNYSTSFVSNRPLSHEIVSKLVRAYPPTVDNVNTSDTTSRFYDIHPSTGDDPNDVSIIIPTFPDVLINVPVINLQLVLETELTLRTSPVNISTAPSPTTRVSGVDSDSMPLGNRVLILINLIFDKGAIEVDLSGAQDIAESVDQATVNELVADKEFTDIIYEIEETEQAIKDEFVASLGIQGLTADDVVVIVVPGSIKVYVDVKASKKTELGITDNDVSTAAKSAAKAVLNVSELTETTGVENFDAIVKTNLITKRVAQLPAADQAKVLAAAADLDESLGSFIEDLGVANFVAALERDSSNTTIVDNEAAPPVPPADYIVLPNDFGYIISEDGVDYLNPTLSILENGNTVFDLSALSNDSASSFNLWKSNTSYGVYDASTKRLTVTTSNDVSGVFTYPISKAPTRVVLSDSTGIDTTHYLTEQASEVKYDFTVKESDGKNNGRTVIAYNGNDYNTPELELRYGRTYFRLEDGLTQDFTMEAMFSSQHPNTWYPSPNVYVVSSLAANRDLRYPDWDAAVYGNATYSTSFTESKVIDSETPI